MVAVYMMPFLAPDEDKQCSRGVSGVHGGFRVQCSCQGPLKEFWICSSVSWWVYVPPVARFSVFTF